MYVLASFVFRSSFCHVFFIYKNACFKIKLEAKEIAQWLRAFNDLKEDMTSILRYNMAAHNIFNSSSEESSALFWTP